ncbi:MAG: GNAT family N-acetyltransferase [Paracoccaceae bacterium]|nr:GNAT family N-acetyltransferase [Paracoccaceae bacterium]
MTRDAITIRALDPDDLDAVAGLFERLFAKLPRGTLYEKSRADFLDLLSARSGGNLGAFENGAMVGYTLVRVAPWDAPYETFPLGDGIARGQPVAVAAGTLVAPEWQGRLLGARLLRARRPSLEAGGVRHAVGEMLIDNLNSVAMYLRTGGAICGFNTDSFGLANFVHYTGPLTVDADQTKAVETARLEEMEALFFRGFICRRLRTKSRSNEGPVFSLAPLAGWPR